MRALSRLKYHPQFDFREQVSSGRPFDLERGQKLVVEGWALDEATNALVPLGALIDGRPFPLERLAMQPPDPLPPQFGFRAVVNVSEASFGEHAFVLTLGEGDSRVFAPPLRFRIESPVAVPRFRPDDLRIAVIASPKSASSYVCQVLGDYFGLGPMYNDWGDPEQIWNEAIVEKLGRRFVAHCHMLPRERNVAFMREHGIHPVILWRNIADSLVSLDDMYMRIENWDSDPQGYTGIPQRYIAMPPLERYRFLIHHEMPFYVHFFLGWRFVGPPYVMRYERLVAEPVEYMRYIIERIAGEVDRSRLDAALGKERDRSDTLLNVGVNGRAVEKMPDEAKALLEEFILSYPVDMTELLDELPWRNGPGVAIAADPSRPWSPATQTLP